MLEIVVIALNTENRQLQHSLARITLLTACTISLQSPAVLETVETTVLKAAAESVRINILTSVGARAIY